MKTICLLFLLLILPLWGSLAQSNEAGKITRLDKAFDQIVPPGAMPEKVASGFIFVEGPVWHPDGFLLFSDIPANRVYRLGADDKPEVFLEKSGYTGTGTPTGEIGSNGLGLDQTGQLLLCQHGNRQLVRQEPSGQLTVLADRYLGRRLNSPNDVICRRDGTLYFTDPSWGLEKNSDKPQREVPFNGVYRWANGQVHLVDSTLVKPNGIGLSPDQRTLYVADMNKKWYAYRLRADGTVKDKRLFFDASAIQDNGHIDGLKVDTKGNVYGTGPNGVMVFSPKGRYLGAIKFAEVAANIGWGGPDGRTLYATCKTSVYRIRLSQRGLPHWQARK
jgi:gluconolactonase